MSEQQIIASRENGAASQGPVTPEGKERSSQNALKHGLCSNRVLLPDESEEDYRAHFICWMRQLQPFTPAERSTAGMVVSAAWRMGRYDRTEAALLTVAMEKFAGDPVAVGRAWDQLATNSRGLDLLNRYAARVRREFERALQTYNDLVQHRREEEARDKSIMTDEAYEKKWGKSKKSFVLGYYERQLDVLPNEPEQPGIFTAMLHRATPKAA